MSLDDAANTTVRAERHLCLHHGFAGRSLQAAGSPTGAHYNDVCRCYVPYVGTRCEASCPWFYDFYRVAGAVSILLAVWACCKLLASWRRGVSSRCFRCFFSKSGNVLLAMAAVGSFCRGVQDLVDPISGSKGLIAPHGLALAIYNVPHVNLIAMCLLMAVQCRKSWQGEEN